MELTTVILTSKLAVPYTFIFLKSWSSCSCHLYILSTDIQKKNHPSTYCYYLFKIQV